jgi:hypothetical protein
MFDFFSTYVVPACMWIPVIVGFWVYKKLLAPHKVILYYSLFAASINIVNLIVIALHHDTILLNHIYTIVEFIFISLYFTNFYGKAAKRVIFAWVVIFEMFCFINLFHLQANAFNSYTQTIAALTYILYCVSFLYKQNAVENDMGWGSNSYNWINTGILAYYGSNIIVFAGSNWIVTLNKQFYFVIWSIHDVIFIAQFVLFAIAFYKCKYQQQTISFS